jgi:tripeptide aminopeptidase
VRRSAIAVITISITICYVVPVKYIVDIAEKAMKELDIKPLIKPILWSAIDGCQLSYM